MMLTGESLIAANKAYAEGRLFWRTADQYGRSCNGGCSNFRPDPATLGKPGEWVPKVPGTVNVHEEALYYVAIDPLYMHGFTVRLVEVEKIVDIGSKIIGCHTFRELATVEPWECIDERIWVAASRPVLHDADLSGADLHGANLYGADLYNADLHGANLQDANMHKAHLYDTNISGSNLDGADLSFTNMQGANLSGANANKANFCRAFLREANLSDTDLGIWERGPDYFARKKEK